MGGVVDQVSGGRRATEGMDRVEEDWSRKDVDEHLERRAQLASGCDFRLVDSEMGEDRDTGQRRAPLDEAGGASAASYRSDCAMLRGGFAVLQQCVSSSETWTKGVSNGGQPKASQPLLGVTRIHFQDGRSSGLLRPRLAGSLDGDLGFGGGFLSPDALLGDVSVLRDRVREAVLQVPCDAFRLEEIDVLHKQVLRDPQEVLEDQTQPASMVPCGRLCSDVHFLLRGSEDERRSPGPRHEEARDHERANQGLLGRTFSAGRVVRFPHRPGSYGGLWDGSSDDPGQEDRLVEGSAHCDNEGSRLLEICKIRSELCRKGGVSVGSLCSSEALDNKDVLGDKRNGEGTMGMGHEGREDHGGHGFGSRVPEGSSAVCEWKSDLALKGSGAASIRLFDPGLGWFGMVQQLRWRASGESTRPLGTGHEEKAHQRQGGTGFLELSQGSGTFLGEQSAAAARRFNDGEFGHQGLQGNYSVSFQKHCGSRGLGMGSGEELFHPADRVRKHSRERARRRRQQMGGHGGLDYFGPSLEVDRRSIRPSHFRPVRIIHKHSLPGFRFSMVSTRLPVAELSNKALGAGTQQLLLPSGVVDTPPVECHTAAEGNGDHSGPRLPSEMVQLPTLVGMELERLQLPLVELAFAPGPSEKVEPWKKVGRGLRRNYVAVRVTAI